MKTLITHAPGTDEYKVVMADRVVSVHPTYGLAEADLLSRCRISSFSGSAIKNNGEPISGPVQIYEDNFPNG